MISVPTIEINLDSVQEDLRLWIDSRISDSLFDAEGDADAYNEARYQLVEGCFYDYELSDDKFILDDIGENIIQQHSRSTNVGTIAPNIFVGTLEIPILEKRLLRCATRFTWKFSL